MPTIRNSNRLRPTLIPNRGSNLRLLQPSGSRPGVFERYCTLTAVAHCLLALWIYFLVPRSVEDPDIWWHLRNAAVQLHTRAWIHHDLYSFTAAGAPWINHEWLAEIPFYLAWRMAGTSGLYAVTLLTIECVLLGVFTIARVQARASLPGIHAAKNQVSIPLLSSAVASVLATVSFGPRMLLFGWLCLVVELLILGRFYQKFTAGPAQHDPWIFALPLLFALWINLHGSWLIGLVLFVTFILAGSFACEAGSLRNLAWSPSQWRRLGLVLLLSIGALFLNPYGWHLVAYPFDMVFRQPLNIASVEEWKPLDFQTVRGLLFLLSLGALFVAQLTRRLNWTLWELASTGIGIYAACRHSRFLFLGAILVMPLLGKQLSRCFSAPAPPRRLHAFEPGRARPRPWLNAAILAATLLLFALGTVKAGHARRDTATEFPAAVLPYLRHLHPQGRVFNEYRWGGYLSYNVPHLPVFIDSRMDIFERNGTLRDYLDIIDLNHSLALLDKYHVRYVLFERDTPLIYLLEQTHAWHADFEDSRFILLERADASSLVLAGSSPDR